MAVSLASAFVRIRPEVNKREFKKAGEEAGQEAGKVTGIEYVRGVDGKITGIRTVGEKAGKAAGEGFAKGAGDKMKEGGGPLGKESEGVGEEAARGFGRGFSRGFKDVKLDNDGAFGTALAGIAARASIAGAAAAGAAPGILQLTAALVPAAGAALAYPAALLSIKAASAVARVAVEDVGDAISAGFGDDPKKAAEALNELSGSTRAFAKEVIALQKPLTDVKDTIGDRFFKPLADEVQPLAQLYLPAAKVELGNLAGALGGLGEQLAQTGRRGVVFDAVRSQISNTTTAAVRLRAGIDPVVQGFAAFIKATAPELPKIATSIANVATQFGGFLTRVSESGAVTRAFAEGKQVLIDLGGIVINLGSILGSVLGAAKEGSLGLLANIRALTGQVAAFLKTGQGGGALTSVFATMSEFGTALRTSLAAVLPAIAQSLAVVGPALAGLAGPVSQIVVALAPLIPFAAEFASILVKLLTPALAYLANLLAENETALKIAVVAIVAFSAAARVAAFAAGVQAAGGIVAWTKATVAGSAIGKAFTAVQYGIGVAMRFALGPIGLIITGITLLVGAIVLAYNKNEGFRKLVQRVWAAIKSAIAATVDWFVNTAWPALKRAFEAVANVVKAAYQNVIRPIFAALSAYVRNVVVPVFNYLWKNVVKPAFSGIQFIIKAAWVVIQTIFRAFVLLLQNVVFPVVRSFYNNVIKPIFRAVGDFVRATFNNVVKPAFNNLKSNFQTVALLLRGIWENIIRPVFRALGNFIKDTVVPAFRTGTTLIKAAWEKVKEYAKKPIEFVVRTVVNPFIGGINKVAKAVGVKDQIPAIPGFARGGQIPGGPSYTDNRLARVKGTRRPLAVASGEFITNTRSTLANLPLVKAINAKRGKVTREDVDPYLDGGYTTSGGDGIGDFFGKLYRGAKGAANAILNPIDSAKKVARAALAKIPGSGLVTNMVRGAASKTIDGAMKWLTNFGLGGAIGGGSVAGGWRGMQRLIAARFPGLPLISGFRPGAITVTGNPSYHGKGRAVDYPPNRSLAMWIKSTFGARTKELITPWQDLNLHNGRPHHYTGRVWSTHNFQGGNAHVHWAARMGGLISKLSGMPIKLFDNGGAWPSGTLGANLSGRTEYVNANRRGDAGGVTIIFGEGAFAGAVIGSAKAAENMVVAGLQSAVRNRRVSLPKGAVRG